MLSRRQFLAALEALFLCLPSAHAISAPGSEAPWNALSTETGEKLTAEDGDDLLVSTGAPHENF